MHSARPQPSGRWFFVVHPTVLLALLLALTSCVDEPDGTLSPRGLYPLSTPHITEILGRSDTSIRLTWTAYPSPQRYVVQGTAEPGVWGGTGLYASVDAPDSVGTQSRTFTNLTPGYTYYFRVRAETNDPDGGNSRWSTVVQGRAADESPPDPVTDIEALDVDGREWLVDWRAPADADGFELRYSTTDDFPEWNGMRPLPALPSLSFTRIRDEDISGDLRLSDITTLAVRARDAAGNLSEPEFFAPAQRITPKDFSFVEDVDFDLPCSVPSFPGLMAEDWHGDLILAQSCGATGGRPRILDLSTDPATTLCDVALDRDVVQIRTGSEGRTFGYVESADADTVVVSFLLPQSLQTESDCQVRSVTVPRSGGSTLIPSHFVIALTSPGTGTGEVGQTGGPWEDSFTVHTYDAVDGDARDVIAVDLPALRAHHFGEVTFLRGLLVREIFADGDGLGLFLELQLAGSESEYGYAKIRTTGEVEYSFRFGVGVARVAWSWSGTPVVYGEREVGGFDTRRWGVWTLRDYEQTNNLLRRLRFFDLGRSLDSAFGYAVGLTYNGDSSSGWLLLEDPNNDLHLLEFRN